MTKESLKSEYKRASGKPVSRDTFVYACMVEEQNLKNLGTAYIPKDRWPLLTHPDQIEFQGTSLENLAGELIAWHVQTNPVLVSDSPLDYGMTARVATAVVEILQDLKRAVVLKTGSNLRFPQDMMSDVLGVAIKSALEQYLPTYAEYVVAYFRMALTQQTPSTIDVNDVPPEGRFFSVHKNNLEKGDRRPSESSFRRPERSDRGHGGERESRSEGETVVRKNETEERRPRHEDRAPREDRPFRESSEDRPRKFDTPSEDRPARRDHDSAQERPPRREERPRHEGRDHRDRDSRDSRGPRHRGDRRDSRPGNDRDRDEARAEMERLALIEVEKASLALKNHSTMNEFRLRPQNSYIRHLQHAKIAALGFGSSSVGEGDERSVVIVRNS